MASFCESTIIDKEDYEVDSEYDTFYDSDDTIIYNYESETKSFVIILPRNLASQNISPQSKPINYFYLFFTAELLNQIVLQTNKYAEKKILKKFESTFNLAQMEKCNTR
ncbi:hypothetical protein LAZ67_10000405 [Cordylochernes scorpioides]|uniref:Uncharacterized protein n=1 Tax=Cordylochernes scorpioides TaxID=51811 RepID=A0ABY6KXV2_9ARAC|nr:hypothetical protein LAZ67_10000405 [Cordylochernes scorpioides]